MQLQVEGQLRWCITYTEEVHGEAWLDEASRVPSGLLEFTFCRCRLSLLLSSGFDGNRFLLLVVQWLVCVRDFFLHSAAYFCEAVDFTQREKMALTYRYSYYHSSKYRQTVVSIECTSESSATTLRSVSFSQLLEPELVLSVSDHRTTNDIITECVHGVRSPPREAFQTGFFHTASDPLNPPTEAGYRP